MKKRMKMKKYAEGASVEMADDEGNTVKDLEKKKRTWKSLSSQSEPERWGRQAGAAEYPARKRTEDSISNPVVRGARRAATYVKDKYGDLRDDIRTAITSDDSAEFRKGQRAVREKHYGYKSGGSVKSSASRRADGIAQRGKTKGRMI